MRLLVLGGTKFLGRHVVEAALARGDEVTIFTRGQTNPDLFPEVERLRGDRDGKLDALAGREWDAVIDPSCYVPRIARLSGELLRDAVGRYVFVSTVSVYADFGKPIDEGSPVAELEDPDTEEVMEHYGALKAACERVFDELYGDRVTHVRAGLSSARTTRPTASRTGRGGSTRAGRCSRRATRMRRCSSSTGATSRPSCSCSPSAAPAARSTRPARPRR
jgi:nucleoside-diphosphate-sugar epimerase